MNKMAKKKIDLIITGMPRSGTSFLCSRVNEMENAVVVNEPQEVFGELRREGIDGVSRLFASYRERITTGVAVPNKIKDGKFIEDTSYEDSRSMHVHKVDDHEFLLGIKNTLVFMSILNQLVRNKAVDYIMASVRHPLDCIASWHKVSFPHLNSAKPEFLSDFAVGKFSTRLNRLLSEDDLYVRSAMLWQLLAQTLLAEKSKIHLVRYEDIVRRPNDACKHISRYLGLNERAQDRSASKPIRRRSLLPGDKQELIYAICKKEAVQLGYKNG